MLSKRLEASDLGAVRGNLMEGARKHNQTPLGARGSRDLIHSETFTIARKNAPAATHKGILQSFKSLDRTGLGKGACGHTQRNSSKF